MLNLNVPYDYLFTDWMYLQSVYNGLAFGLLSRVGWHCFMLYRLGRV